LFIEAVIMFAGILGIWLVTVILVTGPSLEHISFLIIFGGFLLLKKHRLLTHDIKTYNNTLIKSMRKEEEEELISNLLPSFVAEKYFTNPSGSKLEFTDQFSDVTLLFADIKGFTDYSSSHEPEEVVKMLSNLFTEFDKMCNKYDLYKLYTIGDCYVAMSFKNTQNRQPGRECMSMVKFALSLINIIREVRKLINFPGLDMRIGIHTVFIPIVPMQLMSSVL
jgi:phospholipid-translocating ATPase